MEYDYVVTFCPKRSSYAKEKRYDTWVSLLRGLAKLKLNSIQWKNAGMCINKEIRKKAVK
jgi:hypothetical protein